MSQENEFNESEVLEDEILDDENLENEEDLQDADDNAEDDESKTIAELREKLAKAEQAIIKSKKKSGKKVSKQPKKDNDGFGSQVDLLRFNGVPADEIEQIKKIAVMEGTDLIDARNSDYFSIWKEKKQKDVTSKKATVGASRRGRSVTESLDKVKQRIMSGNGTAEDLKRVRKGE